MRTRIERLVFLPFSMGCISESSIAIGEQSPNSRSKRNSNESPTNDKDEDNESLSDRSLKNIPSLLAVPKFQSLLKNFKNLPQLFVYKDDEVEDDDDDTGMDIGFPTDVKHVTHIGIDGTSTSILSRGWDGYFTPTSEIAIPQEHDELNAILPSQDSSHHEVQNACNNHYNPQSLQRAMAGLNINSKSCGI